MPIATIPWRGPGGDRPDLPLPPGPMPLRSAGQLRKRWRYVGVFTEELMLCAARAQIGPLTQSFWVLWDRRERRPAAHTALRPGSREVRMDGPQVEIEARGLRASLRFGAFDSPIESICPSGSAWGWTRKRAGMPVTGTVEIDDRRIKIAGRGIDDESAGYHQRHTSWRWSAGIGDAADGRPLAWNLVEGVNDPAVDSERAIWIAGEPYEPPPVHFDGVAAIDFTAGTRLEFASESAHARDDNYLLIRSRYRHNFGTFAGSLDGTLLATGLGVIEEHDAVW